MADRADAARGALAAGACYLFWGLVPIYWRELAAVDAVELIAHRHLWSLCVLLLLVAARGGFATMFAVLRQPRAVAMHLLSSLLLTTNWLVYVYGVNGGHVTECSLGYFLVPLVNVAAGRFLLHEHLRRAQWFAIAFAGVGVGLLLVQFGELPWIALGLAGSWGAYGLMRKQSPVAGLTGLTVETLLLAPLALAFLLWRQHTGQGALGRVDVRLHALLLSTGVVTALPLVLFAYGAQRIRLTTLGLLQYISPSVQLALAVWVYSEAFTRERAVSFALIWLALVIYTLDNLRAQRRQRVRNNPSGSPPAASSPESERES
jgi:chloramphenicol-sensitive protein RarD